MPRDDRSALRILHVLAPAEVGGLERVVQALCLAQARRGHEPHVAISIDPGANADAFLAPLQDAAIPVTVIRVGARQYAAERTGIRHLVRQLRPHIVHTHGFRPDILHGALARSAGAAAVSTLHGSDRLTWRTRAYERIQERFLKRFDRVIAVSTPLAEHLKGRGIIPTDSIAVLPNGWVDVVPQEDRKTARQALNVSDNVPVIGWVGRLVHAKGADIFLDALSRLPECDWRALIVGDGPERHALQQQAAALGLGVERVEFCGPVRDAGRYFRAFDLFAMSSRTEGTPIVLLEAVAAGVPVVATRVGGIPDVVTDRGAFLAEVSAESLAGALRAALGNAAEAVDRAAVAAERLRRNFGVHEWAERHDDIYHAALRHAQHRART